MPEPTRCPCCGGLIDPDYRAPYQATASTLTGETIVSTTFRSTAPDPASVAAMRELLREIAEVSGQFTDDDDYQVGIDDPSIILDWQARISALLGPAATEGGG